MSFRKSAASPQWAAKLPSPKYTQKNTSSSPADSTTTQREVSNESLLIEDLDLDDLDVSPQSAKTANQSTDEISYEEYPDADSHNPFGEQVPGVISETCIMNDLYILVKVPTNPRSYVPTANKACQTLFKPIFYGQSPNTSRSSGRRIFAIQEEEEEHSVPEPRSKIPVRTQPASKIPCWVRETDAREEFPSKTNIISYAHVTNLPNQVPDETQDQHYEEPSQSHEAVTTPKQCHDQIELQEVNLNSARFKGHDKVSLENYGILITPTKSPKTENLLVFQVDTEQKAERAGSGGTSCFDWFTKCFHRKRRRTGLMHAKVYKTYFVKWKKCAEVIECPRCQCKAGKSLRRNSA